MATTVPRVASATSPFAHLATAAAVQAAGTAAAVAAKAEETDDEKKAREDDEAKAKKKAEEDEKKKDDDAKAKKKAEDDEKKKDDEAKALAAKTDGDDDSDSADWANPQARAIRARERGRIAAIVHSEAASLNMKAATHFALKTNMSRETAIGTLMGMEPQAAVQTNTRPASTLGARMQEVPKPALGAGDGNGAGSQMTDDQKMAQAIVNAGAKRRGEKV